VDPPAYDWSDPQLEARLARALGEWATDLGIHGAAAAVLTPGWFAWSGSFGLDDVETGAPYQPDSVGYVASITKPFTATTIMQLIDEGLLSLDTPMAQFLPDYPNSENITVEHLLRHRSGIPEVQLVDLLFVLSVLLDPGHWIEPEEILKSTYKKFPPMVDMGTFEFLPRQPVGEPGEKYHYSQPGYVALGIIIEQVTGKPLADVFDERICQVLCLSATRLAREEDTFFAPGYTNLFGLLPEKMRREELVGTQAQGLHSSGWAAAGLTSTASDLVLFLSAMIEGRLFSEQSLAHVTDWMVIPDPKEPGSYAECGMGLVRSRDDSHVEIGHTGGLPGAVAIMKYIVELDVYVGAVANTDVDDVDVPSLEERIVRALRNEP